MAINSIRNLKLKANDIRQDTIKALVEANSGHSAGPLDLTDVFTALYFKVMKHNPKKPNWPGRDRFVLSCGHVCPGLYTTLAHAGYFPKKELKTLRKLGTRLEGHPHNTALPGIETSSGPLGQGTSQSVGMAMAAKLDKKNLHVWTVTSDGEHNEGQTWEAIMCAAKFKLDNLTFFLDRNHIQIDGNTEDIMPMGDIGKKYKAFGWYVIDINGNNMKQILDACAKAKKKKGKPTIIVCHTTPGMGVKFMNDYTWHGKPPKPDEAKKALAELEAGRKKI